MPELPEVETVRRGLAPYLQGARIERVDLNRKNLRFPLPKAFAAKVKGAKILRIERRAKYLLFYLSNGLVLLSHLGMSGRYRIESKEINSDPGAFYDDAPAHNKHDHVILHLSGAKRLTYNDARRFGFMELIASNDIGRRFEAVGTEPLSKVFNGKILQRLLKGKKAPIKAALLDQRLIAGIGNIYACEALFKAGISPKKPAGRLTAQQCNALAKAIKDVLKKAIRLGGSTLNDFHDAAGSAGRFQHEFEVYDRKGEPCPRCWRKIASITQSGRSTFYCPACQH